MHAGVGNVENEDDGEEAKDPLALRHVMPWRIEDELKKLGANYIQGGLWRDLPCAMAT